MSRLAFTFVSNTRGLDELRIGNITYVRTFIPLVLLAFGYFGNEKLQHAFRRVLCCCYSMFATSWK